MGPTRVVGPKWEQDFRHFRNRIGTNDTGQYWRFLQCRDRLNWVWTQTFLLFQQSNPLVLCVLLVFPVHTLYWSLIILLGICKGVSLKQILHSDVLPQNKLGFIKDLSTLKQQIIYPFLCSKAFKLFKGLFGLIWLHNTQPNIKVIRDKEFFI